MIKLKPCPFCGGEAQVEQHGRARVSCIVSCSECGCTLESNEQGAGHCWNMRSKEQNMTDTAQRRAEALYADIADEHLDKNYVIDTLYDYAQQARRDALEEAAKAQCMYCNDQDWEKRDSEGLHASPHTGTMYPCAAWKIWQLDRLREEGDR